MRHITALCEVSQKSWSKIFFVQCLCFPIFWHPLPGITSQGKYIVGQGFSFFSTFLIPPDFQSPCPLQSQVSKVRNAPHRAYWGVDGQNYKYLTFLSTWITNLRRKDCIKDVVGLFLWMKNLVQTPLNVFRTVCQGDKWKPERGIFSWYEKRVEERS